MSAQNSRTSKPKTAILAEPLGGNKLYQQRAKAALPLLVRQALAQEPITYGDLAPELNMSNPRNLNYVLGCVGRSLAILATEWDEKIPPIQFLAVNKHRSIPGDGVYSFNLSPAEVARLTSREKRRLVDKVNSDIYHYRRWRDVLNHFQLPFPEINFSGAVKSAAAFSTGGESEAHRTFKEWIAKHPTAVGLSAQSAPGICEFPLPSGDVVDVLFTHKSVNTAVETKSAISDNADLVRGLFQCIKYQSVLEATLLAKGERADAEAILALEAALPPALIPLKNLLGVRVIDDLSKQFRRTNQ